MQAGLLVTPSLPVLDLLPPAPASAAVAAALPGEFLALLDGCLDVAAEAEEKSRLGAVPIAPLFVAQPVMVEAEAPADPVEPSATRGVDVAPDAPAPIVAQAPEAVIEEPDSDLPPQAAIAEPPALLIVPVLAIAVTPTREEAASPDGPVTEEHAVVMTPPVTIEPEVEPPVQPRPAPAVEATAIEIEERPAGPAPAPAELALEGSEAPEVRVDRPVAPAPAPLPQASQETRAAAGRVRLAAPSSAPAEAVPEADRPETIQPVEYAAEGAPAASRAPRREVAFAARVVEAAAPKAERETEAAQDALPAPVTAREPLPVAPATQDAAAAENPEPVAAGDRAPVRAVSVKLAENVRVQVAGQGGEVRVVVRSPDPALNETLRERLPQLVENLEAGGFAAETWQPAPVSRSAGEMSSGNGARDQQDAGGDGQQQQHQRERRQPQDLPEWLAELERSRRQ